MPTDCVNDSYKVLALDNLLYGPIDFDVLTQWVRELRVQRDTWLLCQDENVWRQARDIEPLRDSFPHAASDNTPAIVPGAGHAISAEELRQFSLFAGISNALLEQFADFGDLYEVQTGQILLRKGEPGDSLFFVLTGEVRVRLMIGREDKTLNKIPGGEFFGEMSMLNHAPRSADVVAETDARLLRMTSQAFLKMIDEIPELAAPVLFSLARTMAGRISESNQKFQREVASEFLWR